MPARDYIEMDPNKKIDSNLKNWSDHSSGLHKLKECIDYAVEFRNKFGEHMHAKDRLELVEVNQKYERLYWKYFQRLVQRIQGLSN
jgi:hypothetical protein